MCSQFFNPGWIKIYIYIYRVNKVDMLLHGTDGLATVCAGSWVCCAC